MSAANEYEMKDGHQFDYDVKKSNGNTNTCYLFTFAITFLLVAGAVTAICVVYLPDNNSNGGSFEPVIGMTTTPRPDDICMLKLDSGSCNSKSGRWGWDSEQGACVAFDYWGCSGNENNFMSEDDCKSACGDAGGLPKTCIQLQDTPFDTMDVSPIFGTSITLRDVAPPSNRVGNLRAHGALPTGHFACNQINHGALTPIRQFPHSAVMDINGITYEAYTFDRWTNPARQDPFYDLTPGKDGAPWEKFLDLGYEIKQMTSAPDSTPFSLFTGLSGVRVGIQDNIDEPIMTDFGEMYANFLYTDENGGTMELPLVRGSGMLTHIFTDATPILTPYCLQSINGQSASSECPEEKPWEFPGQGFVEASCSSTTNTSLLIVHHTKPIQLLSEVQYRVMNFSDWHTSEEGFRTCSDADCQLSSDGMTTTINIQGSMTTLAYSINIIGKYCIPQHDYGNYWYWGPVQIPCTTNSDVSVARGGRMPVWFYGTGSIDTVGCGRENVVNTVTVTLKLSQPARYIHEIQYKVADINVDLTTVEQWITCTGNECEMQDGGTTIVITLVVNEASVNFAANVISQFITESIPFNWRRQPEKIYCPNAVTEPTPQTLTLTGNSFNFELSEPIGSTTSTRKYAVFFSEQMKMTFDENGAIFMPDSPSPQKFNGIMQLVYAGSGSLGDTWWVNQLKKYAGVYSYKPKTRFCTEGDTGYISFDWNKRGEDFLASNPNLDLLTVALPHHVELLENGQLVDTPFGFKGFKGDQWVMEEALPPASMEPNMDAVNRIKQDPVRLQHILDAIETDALGHTLDHDCLNFHSYEAGKSIGLVSRLASISRAFGTDHYEQLDLTLRWCLDLWLGIEGGIVEDNVLKYDTVWGGLWMRGAAEGEPLYPHTNYGFISYADHHFHFGYWLYATAYYATYYPEWAKKEENYNRIMAMARDVGNPSKNDPFFPTVRQKDWYLGSSWATGIGGGARQEESSSEGINCYHALAALGLALNDPVLQATGQVTLASEIRATRWYWHVRENNRQIFPSVIQDWGVVGQVAEEGIFYYTINWPCSPDQYPQRHACLVGIQIIPIISVSYLYMDEEWGRNVYDICYQACNADTLPEAAGVDNTWYNMARVSTKWSAFCQSIMAKVDAQKQLAAAEHVRHLPTSALEPGTGVASTLLFIYEST